MRKTSSRCSIRLHPVQKCARKLRVIYCIDSEDKEFNARKKLETPLAPPMHSKTCKKGQNGETRSKTNDFKSKLACILEARVNPQDCVWKNLYLIMMRTTLQEKGTIHYSITNMVHKLCPKQWRYPQQKQQWMNGRNLKRFWRGTKQKSEVNQRWSMKQGRRAQKVLFASLMDICHLKNAELETKYQKYKGRLVLRGNIVKDDSGSYAVFTEQASQMTAAKVMDIISRLPGCAGQAADAVSAYTQARMEDAPRLQKIPKSECPDIWIRLPRHKWTKSWSNIEDPVVLLERKLYGHPLVGLLGAVRRSSVGTLVQGKQGLFNSMHMWMISKWLEDSQPLSVRGVRPGHMQNWWKLANMQEIRRQLILDKTIGSWVWWHTQSLCGHLARSKVGTREPGSRLAIDWVTDRSYFCVETAQCTVRPT